MADIAAIFHWPLDQIEALPADELFAWRDRAITRWNWMYGDKE